MTERKSKFGNWLRTSITARMLVVGILILVLLIPLSFVKDLIYERSKRQKQVVNEINQKWGDEILLSGPILKIPYKIEEEQDHYNPKTKETTTKIVTRESQFYVFPDKLDYDSKLKSKALERSIYKSVVFLADIDVNGNFPAIDLSNKNVDPDDILWDKASVILKTTNLKGIKSQVKINLGGKAFQLFPKYEASKMKTLESKTIANFKSEKGSDLPFHFKLKINGSESLKFVPIGKTTTASMSSNWSSPSFDGNFLPEDGSREITKDGFSAKWKVLQINRQFEQQFKDNLPNLQQFGFGTNLLIPVDEYQKTERTAKYGFMVIGITFLVFLLIQIISKIYIHPFQYLMVGLSLVMFYTLLLSISEHQNFLFAYLVSGISVLALITIYSKFIFKNKKFPALIGASLTAVYSFIYVIIQLENYALLVGSIGLFIILAIVMFASRKIDWNTEG